MEKRFYVSLTLCMVMAFILLLPRLSHGMDVPRITKEELKGKLCSKNLILLDVRVSGSWEGNTRKIKCAQRVDPDSVASWSDKLPKDKEIVLYCS